MKKIATIIIALVIALGGAVQPVQAAPQYGPDVRLMKQVTISSYYQLSHRYQEAVCWGWKYRHARLLAQLAEPGIDYGISRRDARKGVRKAMNQVCY